MIPAAQALLSLPIHFPCAGEQREQESPAPLPGPDLCSQGQGEGCRPAAPSPPCPPAASSTGACPHRGLLPRIIQRCHEPPGPQVFGAIMQSRSNLPQPRALRSPLPWLLQAPWPGVVESWGACAQCCDGRCPVCPRVPPCARCSSQGFSLSKVLREHLLCSNKSAGCSGERGPTLGSPARWELSASSRLCSVTYLLPGVPTRSPTRTAQGSRVVLAALCAVPGSRCPSCSQPGRELWGAPPVVVHRVCAQLASSQHTGAPGPWVGDQQQGWRRRGCSGSKGRAEVALFPPLLPVTIPGARCSTGCCVQELDAQLASDRSRIWGCRQPLSLPRCSFQPVPPRGPG